MFYYILYSATTQDGKGMYTVVHVEESVTDDVFTRSTVERQERGLRRA
jgi:hypothetical protein